MRSSLSSEVDILDIAVPAFTDVVPYLDHPLALIGYGLCLFFAFLSAVLKAGARNIDAATRTLLFRLSLMASTVLLVVVVGSFALHAMTLASERRETGTSFVGSARPDAEIVASPVPLGDTRIVREQVDAAISLLQQWRAWAGSARAETVDRAIRELKQGEAGMAVALLSERLEAVQAQRRSGDASAREDKEVAAIAQALGGLTFLTDTQTALEAYRLLVELSPKSWVGWYQLSLLEIRVGNYTKAIAAAQKVRDIGEQADDEAVAGRGLQILGVVARLRSNLDQAASLGQRAVEKLKGTADREGLAIAFGSLGIVRRMRGDYEAAEQLHRDALEIEKELDEPIGIAREYGNLGTLLLAKGQAYWEQAESYIELSLAYNEKAGSLVGIGMRANQLGEFAMRRKDWEAARTRFEEALRIAEDLDDPYGKGRALSNLGRLHKLVAQFEDQPSSYAKAETLYRDAMDIYESLGNRIGQAIVNARLARLYQRRDGEGDLARARDRIAAALAISREEGHPRATIDYLRTSGDVNLALGNKEQACDGWREAIALQRQLDLGPDEREWFERRIERHDCTP
jgi:tetratricopeptide (TPR) repeat protein